MQYILSLSKDLVMCQSLTLTVLHSKETSDSRQR